ncbi:PREDICTED: uncharacterized protein LOC105458837 isoform X2 [Wasmannia auropunctata]|uniref:uncharacterized protein LOC105458837 isoform X2 n=1 Tax=Wasmannia auropunctata TaxID=64793 RepID=UPI0005ED5ADF|nr:PREDICTED: uncharacterized protein LOC105458837 isoform X2 [Wasmannia auropunctata]
MKSVKSSEVLKSEVQVWQYHGHHCCPDNKKTAAQQKFDSKRSKNYTLETAKKLKGKSDFDGYVNVVSKSGTNGSHEHKSKRSQKKRSKKGLEYQSRSDQKITFPEGLEVRKFDEKDKFLSAASQTINDTKSTIVMEFSTVQKLVQIVDNDPDINSARAPFKEIVIQKDTADKKHDNNIEQNFEANVTATDS